ncbi:polysaccharide pyruvyl transferase family protein [Marivirga sp.]|uniref:polysaccharide pyruvyl transferase family protein n=1 Tax=Marivirga sp. TaxID=2018662 RepID=UPI003DA6DD25
MKKYTIISTFPAEGTQNIGDALITEATKAILKRVKGENITFDVIWRADSWKNVKDQVLKSECVIFACLAIRENMDTITYPFINQIIDSNIPYGILSAGTSLNTNRLKWPLKLESDSSLFLKKLYDNAIFFSTRGILTQQFCLDNDLKGCVFTGDVAFFDSRFEKRKFSINNNIKKIVISDPHYSKFYMKGFDHLIKNLRNIFPGSSISVHIHGINKEVVNYCVKNEINHHLIYQNVGSGLDLYDEYDLHVGFRVHGHVSMLKRRKPSYLLEQDGRGHDYGLSINLNSSYPCFNPVMNQSSIINKLSSKIFPNKVNNKHIYSVNIISEIIKEDKKENFIKFLGFERQIKGFIDKLHTEITKLP